MEEFSVDSSPSRNANLDININIKRDSDTATVSPYDIRRCDPDAGAFHLKKRIQKSKTTLIYSTGNLAPPTVNELEETKHFSHKTNSSKHPNNPRPQKKPFVLAFEPTHDKRLDGIFQELEPSVFIIESALNSLEMTISSARECSFTCTEEMSKTIIAMLVLLTLDVKGNLEELGLNCSESFPYIHYNKNRIRNCGTVKKHWGELVNNQQRIERLLGNLNECYAKLNDHLQQVKDIARESSAPTSVVMSNLQIIESALKCFIEVREQARQIDRAFYRVSKQLSKDNLSKLSSLAREIDQYHLTDMKIVSDLYWDGVFEYLK